MIASGEEKGGNGLEGKRPEKTGGIEPIEPAFSGKNEALAGEGAL